LWFRPIPAPVCSPSGIPQRNGQNPKLGGAIRSGWPLAAFPCLGLSLGRPALHFGLLACSVMISVFLAELLVEPKK
jgi:hypothetical protein